MPVTKQSIAFIGTADPIASALARGTATGNYRLLLFDQVSEEIIPLVKDIRGSTPDADICIMDCAHECSWEADIIMLNVSEDEFDNVISDIHDVATQKIVVQLSHDQTQIRNSTEKVHRELPYSKIIHLWTTKTFDLANQSKELGELYVSGSDMEALQTISKLIETAGFNPVVRDIIKEN
jgi:predicted dinucleotide-binding enzyme